MKIIQLQRKTDQYEDLKVLLSLLYFLASRGSISEESDLLVYFMNVMITLYRLVSPVKKKPFFISC